MNIQNPTSRAGAVGRRAFTLLEVLLAVLILGMITLVLSRFINAQLTAIGLSEDANAEQRQIEGVVKYLKGVLGELPPRGQGMLQGQHAVFSGRTADELTWRTFGGQGLLTAAGAGEEWMTTLMLRPRDGGSSVWDLGLRRRPVDGTGKEWNWVTLIPEVYAMRIRYFDPRLNQAVDRWNDQNTRPALVVLELWRHETETPQIEAIIPVPSANVRN